MTRAAELREERAQAIDTLRAMVKPGDTIHTVLRHVSRSGMTRHIDLYLIEDGEPYWLSGLAARAMGERTARDGGIIIGGCGMDMGFALVYNLSRTLYPDGFPCIGFPDGDRAAQRGCPSNDHVNARDWSVMPGMHSDGGYALRHRWL